MADTQRPWQSPPPEAPHTTGPHLDPLDEQRVTGTSRCGPHADGRRVDFRHLQPPPARQENVAILVSWFVNPWTEHPNPFLRLQQVERLSR